MAGRLNSGASPWGLRLIIAAALLLLRGAKVDAIATNRVNLILDRTMRVDSLTTSGQLCDSGMTVSPEEKESSLHWHLDDIYTLHEIKIEFESTADASAVEEMTAAMGFSDSNFFTLFRKEKKDEPYKTKTVLLPACFAERQWGASGSHLRIDITATKKFKIKCIEALGVKPGGNNVMVGKPLRGENPCKNGLHFINDVFEDGYLNYKNPPFVVMADLGKAYKPKSIDVDVDGKWDDGEILLSANFVDSTRVDSCKEARKGQYKCPLDGSPVRFLTLRGKKSLPKIKEIHVNV